MTGRELRERGFLYFEAIREGLDSYENEIVVMDGRKAFEHFLRLKEKYGEDNSFLDFYLFSLKKCSKAFLPSITTISFS